MPSKKNIGETDLKKKNKESALDIGKMLQQDAPSTSIGNQTEKKANEVIMSKTRKMNELPKNAVLSKKPSKIKELSKFASGEKAAGKSSLAENRNPKRGKTFRYEIDCGQVKDSIDVNKLHRYVSDQLKVNGRKNNLGDIVTVCCVGDSVVVTSKVYLPKKSLRYLSKNFLKKTWNVCVKSKDKNSYEFKYVGSL